MEGTWLRAWDSATGEMLPSTEERAEAVESVNDELGRELSDECERAENERKRKELNLFRGRQITAAGDGFMTRFDSPTRAVLGAAAMTRAATSLGLAIRVGIHTGEITFVGRDARGLAVHAAARVMGVAGPGEVLVSSTTRDLVEGSGIAFADAGTHELKGLTGARSLARLVST